MATQYQEWAKRNWPTVAANDPDRFVEFSQADLDAYAEKAFAAGARGPTQERNWWRLRCDMGRAWWRLRCDMESGVSDQLRADLHRQARSLLAYQCVALLGWVGAVLSLLGV